MEVYELPFFVIIFIEADEVCYPSGVNGKKETTKKNAQDLPIQIEASITNLLTGAEEMQINGRKYRKTDLDKLRVMRQNLREKVFF